MPGRELVEWLGDDGSVIEVVSRARMRAERLSHRCTYVVVVVGPPDRFEPGRPPPELEPGDEVIVHRRADWKDVYPSHWDLAFGGVCGVGEPWEASARRELAEEAGIELEGRAVVDLGPTRFVEPGDDGRPQTIVFGRIYLASWPDPAVSTDGEAVAFDRVALADLARWLDEEAVCPDSTAVVAPVLLALAAGTGPGPVGRS